MSKELGMLLHEGGVGGGEVEVRGGADTARLTQQLLLGLTQLILGKYGKLGECTEPLGSH